MRIVIVSRDPVIRDAAARAFDDAPPSWSVRISDDEPRDADVVVSGPDVTIPGSVCFDPASPATAVAQIASSVVRGATIVGVVGAQGGCGVTTVALHLARALGRDRASLYLESDPACGGRSRLAAHDALRWETGAGAMTWALPMAGGFRVAFAPDVPHGLQDAIDAAARDFDGVVVDLPPRAALGRDARLVLVMPPTATGARRARDLLASRPEGRWVVVTNRTGPGGEASRAELQRLVGRRIAALLPCSPRLRDAEADGGLPSPSWSRWCRRITALARALVEG